MEQSLLESKIQELSKHAWGDEINHAKVVKWLNNFTGECLGDQYLEKKYATFLLTKYMYFKQKLVREMLKSLYRDHFFSPMRQRIRRNYGNTLDLDIINRAYEQELNSTRFIGVGNPSESGAHLLYFFRQVNFLKKDLFADFSSLLSYSVNRDDNSVRYDIKGQVTRLVFFDDLIGTASQIKNYLLPYLSALKFSNPNLDIRFMSLFATSNGLENLNKEQMFNGKAISLFELDESYKTFSDDSRYFLNLPLWCDSSKLQQLAIFYGKRLWKDHPLGYKNSQLLMGFSHNTPDNTLPLFWFNHPKSPWFAIFERYHKQYD